MLHCKSRWILGLHKSPLTNALFSPCYHGTKKRIITRSSSSSSPKCHSWFTTSIDGDERIKDDAAENGSITNQDNKGSILFLSPTSWPEPNATAAGTRTMSLLHHFSMSMSPSIDASSTDGSNAGKSSLFHSVHFGCGANVNNIPSPSSSSSSSSSSDEEFDSSPSNSNSSMIQWHPIKPNRQQDMEHLIETIETMELPCTISHNQQQQHQQQHNNNNHRHRPIQAVIFDRFYAEEAYSFRIRQLCPTAVRILDMQDVHSLRLGRQCLVEEYDKGTMNMKMNKQKKKDAKNDTNDDNGNGNGGGGGKYQMTKELIKQVMNFDPSSNTTTTTTTTMENLTQNNINDNHHHHSFHNKTTATTTKDKKAHDTFLRELASVHRSDLVLVCSSAEMEMMERVWNIPRWKLVPASFFCDELRIEDGISAKGYDDDHDDNGNNNNNSDNTTNSRNTLMPTFTERTDFATVGGFKHPPNIDSIKVLYHTLWPRIRSQLPNAQMHIYGAYPTQEILSMHDEAAGFLVHGHVQDLDTVLRNCRVLLAPLRFGAGIKGKIVDAWRCGCPVVTTLVGAEGMRGDSCYATSIGCSSSSSTSSSQHSNWSKNGSQEWGGMIAEDANDFVNHAVRLYNDKNVWNNCQEKGTFLLNTLFSGKNNLPIVEKAVHDAMTKLKDRRNRDIIGSLMWHQSARSTEYFSRWIELKETILQNKENNKP